MFFPHGAPLGAAGRPSSLVGDGKLEGCGSRPGALWRPGGTRRCVVLCRLCRSATLSLPAARELPLCSAGERTASVASRQGDLAATSRFPVKLGRFLGGYMTFDTWRLTTPPPGPFGRSSKACVRAPYTQAFVDLAIGACRLPGGSLADPSLRARRALWETLSPCSVGVIARTPGRICPRWASSTHGLP